MKFEAIYITITGFQLYYQECLIFDGNYGNSFYIALNGRIILTAELTGSDVE